MTGIIYKSPVFVEDIRKFINLMYRQNLEIQDRFRTPVYFPWYGGETRPFSVKDVETGNVIRNVDDG